MLQSIKLRKNTLKLYFGGLLIGFLLGSLLLLVMCILQKNGILRDNEFTVATVGTMMSLTIFFAVYVFGGMAVYRLWHDQKKLFYSGDFYILFIYGIIRSASDHFKTCRTTDFKNPLLQPVYI